MANEPDDISQGLLLAECGAQAGAGESEQSEKEPTREKRSAVVMVQCGSTGCQRNRTHGFFCEEHMNGFRKLWEVPR